MSRPLIAARIEETVREAPEGAYQLLDGQQRRMPCTRCWRLRSAASIAAASTSTYARWRVDAAVTPDPASRPQMLCCYCPRRPPWPVSARRPSRRSGGWAGPAGASRRRAGPLVSDQAWFFLRIRRARGVAPPSRASRRSYPRAARRRAGGRDQGCPIPSRSRPPCHLSTGRC